MKKFIRKTWPKVRMVTIKEQTFYRADARRIGTDGKQETFKSQKEAEKRAGEIASQFGTNGKEGLSFPAELRGMALTADRILKPYGRTLLQAVEFYKAHLDADQQRKDSVLVPVLAQEWYGSKKSGKTQHLQQQHGDELCALKATQVKATQLLRECLFRDGQSERLP